MGDRHLPLVEHILIRIILDGDCRSGYEVSESARTFDWVPTGPKRCPFNHAALGTRTRSGNHHFEILTTYYLDLRPILLNL
jgi:hypothetical protein